MSPQNKVLTWIIVGVVIFFAVLFAVSVYVKYVDI